MEEDNQQANAASLAVEEERDRRAALAVEARVDQLISSMNGDGTTFLQLVTPDGVDRNVTSAYEARDRIKAKLGTSGGVPVLGACTFEEGGLAEHLAASPIRWCITIGFGLALAICFVAGVVDTFGVVTKGSQLAAYVDRARDPFTFGFVVACGTLALITTRRVHGIVFRRSWNDAEPMRMVFASRQGVFDRRRSAYYGAATTDDEARSTFLRRNPIPTNDRFVRLGATWLRLADVAEVTVRTRPRGLGVAGLLTVGLVACLAYAWFFGRPAGSWGFSGRGFAAGFFVVWGVLLYIAALIGIFATSVGLWALVVGGGWAEESCAIVVRTGGGKARHVGACEPSHAAVIAADVAAILAHATQATGDQS